MVSQRWQTAPLSWRWCWWCQLCRPPSVGESMGREPHSSLPSDPTPMLMPGGSCKTLSDLTPRRTGKWAKQTERSSGLQHISTLQTYRLFINASILLRNLIVHLHGKNSFLSKSHLASVGFLDSIFYKAPLSAIQFVPFPFLFCWNYFAEINYFLRIFLNDDVMHLVVFCPHHDALAKHDFCCYREFLWHYF